LFDFSYSPCEFHPIVTQIGTTYLDRTNPTRSDTMTTIDQAGTHTLGNRTVRRLG